MLELDEMEFSGNGEDREGRDTIPSPPLGDEMRDALLLHIAARVERLDAEAEARLDREKRIEILVQEIHVELFRIKQGQSK